jgi:LPS-assembly lipoprotein
MWWLEQHAARRGPRLTVRLAVAFALAGLCAGCFEPLYGSKPTVDSESVRDKLAAVEVPAIPVRQGSTISRLAVAMRNALQYDFNGGAGAHAPTHRLEMTLSASQATVIIDITTGRPTAQVNGVTANFRLVEIATGKIVLRDTAFSRVDYDIPGEQQRFAKDRANRDAEDRATQQVAESIRNRLASYFVAGT